MLNKDKKYYSYSNIKRFINEGPSSLITKNEFSNKGMNKGTMLEDMLMMSNFEDKYYIAEEDIGTLTSMERKLLDAKIERSDKDYNYLKEDLGFFKSDNEKDFNNRVDKIHKFYDGYKESKDKIFVKKDNWVNIFTMANALKNDSNTSSFFNNDNIEKIQNIYQKTINFKYKEYEFKCIIDIIQIDKENNTVQSVDLKYTHVPLQMFENEFFKLRYDIQSCLYSLALNQFIEDNNLTNYSIIEPAYLVVNDNLETCKFIIDTSILKNAWNGYKWNNYDKKGIEETINLIKWHIDNEVYNVSKDYYILNYVRLKSKTNIYSSSFNNIEKFTSKSEKEITNALLLKNENLKTSSLEEASYLSNYLRNHLTKFSNNIPDDVIKDTNINFANNDLKLNNKNHYKTNSIYSKEINEQEKKEL